uniref:Terpene synthase N-terminal domain-containing protein n=1 Tax=Cucumis sativus TaxID=3659 RepID=A0A0A0L337_CUCSA
MDNNGKFKESLVEDERGILSLYEASHMRGHGEALLEEALEFTTTHLKAYIHLYSNINPNFASEVSNALKFPIRKCVPRVKAREYFEIYQQQPSHNETLLTFSKQTGLQHLTKTSPEGDSRNLQMRRVHMVNLLLPEYMKVYYRTDLLDLFEEMDKEIVNDGISYRSPFAKEAMKRQAESYFKEAGWLNKNYKPKYEEYMEVALTTSGYELLSTISFIGMGDIATKEVFDWLSDCPKILKASSIICRALTSLRKKDNILCLLLNVTWIIMDVHKKKHVLSFLSRVMALLYSDEGGYTNSKGRTKLLIQPLLINP